MNVAIKEKVLWTLNYLEMKEKTILENYLIKILIISYFFN
jgi:hypothetical protein